MCAARKQQLLRAPPDAHHASCSRCTVIVLLLALFGAAFMLTPSSTPACSDCSAAHALHDAASPELAVDYADVTFFLGDAESVDRFITNPEAEVPASIKATSLWSNPAYWLGDNKAVRCACA